MFFDEMINMIDFSHCEPDLTATYGVSDKKWGVFYNNEKYIIKTPDRIDDSKRNEVNSSHSNSVISEYLCCHIFQEIWLQHNKL